MNTLFIPSFYFPPYAGVGVIRTAKHCKLLPNLGWKPLVLTVRDEYYGGRVVEKITEDVRHTKAIRIPFVRLPGIVLIIKLLFPLMTVFFIFRNRKKIDAIYISGSPFYPFPLTFFCTKILGIPAILDFRDSWSINFGYDGSGAKNFLHSLRQRIYRAIEYVGIMFASDVVFSTPVLRTEYSELFKKFKYKFHTIYNGFDEDDFENLIIDKKTRSKTLILTGQFAIYTPEIIDYLFTFLKKHPDFRFIYVGSEYKIINEVMNQHKLEHQVEIHQYLSYEKVLQLITKADYGLVTNGMKNGLGTKIFDYLALNKPTLCFVPKDSMISHEFGDLAHVIISEAPHTLESVSRAIKDVLEVKQVKEIQNIKKYTRQEATKQLVDLLAKYI